MSQRNKLAACLAFLVLLLAASPASADITNAGVLDDVLGRFKLATAFWKTYMVTAATWLYWTLVVISMVWTFGIMAVRKAELNEFFAEFIKFVVMTGFFWWLLTNGPDFAVDIFESLRKIAGNASGFASTTSPSGIIDIGFFIFESALDQSSRWSPVDSTVGILMALAILVLLALTAVNMLLLLCAAWILAYGAIFFLGFGGSKWTSDIAINYFKSMLGVGAQLMAMVLIVGVGKTFLDSYYSNMSKGLTMMEMAVMIVVTIIIYILATRVPPMFSGIVSGATPGAVGSFGAGSALAVAGAAAAAAAVGAAAISAGMANAAGTGQAMMAAFSKGSENVESGSDLMSNLGGGSDSGAGSFADAAGLNSADSGGSAGGDSGGADGGKKLSRMSKAALVTADATGNIVKAAGGMAKEKIADRTASTLGGKLAKKIKRTGSDEVDNFVNRSD